METLLCGHICEILSYSFPVYGILGDQHFIFVLIIIKNVIIYVILPALFQTIADTKQPYDHIDAIVVVFSDVLTSLIQDCRNELCFVIYNSESWTFLRGSFLPTQTHM